MVDARLHSDPVPRPRTEPRESDRLDLQAAVLRRAYLDGSTTVTAVVEACYTRIAARGDDGVWITLVPVEVALERARELDTVLTDILLSAPAALGSDTVRTAAARLPALFGLPFAVKDNIDVAGCPTTAACEEFAYLPPASAPLVDALVEAGAVCLGKTNLDQFATGLSGARSPYGIPTSPFDPEMIAGGSSSGSGVAVAEGLVTFAIGTDTAGSGRVPAALTNTVGLKPTRGLVSTTGVVPACRSLDCPSVFAASVADARAVLSVIEGFDPADPYSRRWPPTPGPRQGHRRPPRLGVGRAADLEFFGNSGAEAVYRSGIALISSAGAELVTVDLSPFLEAGSLLYGGPWLAERYAGVGGFVAEHPDAVHPAVLAVLEPGAAVSGATVFRGLTRLAELRRATETCWDEVDALVLPTVGTTYRVKEMIADPLRLNVNLGRYTTFVNLLDLAAIAVPSGFAGGLPFGVTFIGPAGSDGMLADLAAQAHARSGLRVGTSAYPLVEHTDPAPPGPPPADLLGFVELAVVGAHLSGLPLNAELVQAGASLVCRTRTTSDYRLFALPSDGGPRRPGLVRVSDGGAAIDAEIWRLPTAGVGRFLLGVPAPLAIGTVATEFGRTLGFVCEAAGAEAAEDVTAFGGWRRYLAQASTAG